MKPWIRNLLTALFAGIGAFVPMWFVFHRGMLEMLIVGFLGSVVGVWFLELLVALAILGKEARASIVESDRRHRETQRRTREVHIAYLVGTIDTEAWPPILVSIDVHSERAADLTTTSNRHYRFDIATGSGFTYEQAQQTLLSDAARMYPWIVLLLKRPF